MSLDRFCRKPIVTCLENDSVCAAAEKMEAAHVGAVVVVDRNRSPMGILTDRDVATRVVAGHRDPDSTEVREVMTAGVHTVPRSASLDSALFAMRDHGVRRLPILDDHGAVCGLLALDDLLVLLSAELGMTAEAARMNQGP